MIHIYTFFATFAYVGYLPKMPGTWGSLAAAVLIYLIGPLPVVNTVLIILSLTLIGQISTRNIEKMKQIEDPGYIVIDEVVGMWIAVFTLPVTIPVLISGFILFRLFDIWKPSVIDRSQSLPNGWGVMVDDILAGLAALAVNYMLFFTGIL